MILSIGEILADMIEEEQNGVKVFRMHVGGAPFNMAVNAKNAGAKVGFVGRVGCDFIGKFLKGFATAAGLDSCDIQEDERRNTTLAFVTLKAGERDFTFFRHDTADFNLDSASVLLEQWPEVNIVHVGSLMLNELAGRKFASEMVEKIRRAGKLFSFDVNFRADLFGRMGDARESYAPYIAEADILKFSEDELAIFTGKVELEAGVEALYKRDRLLLITLGSKGCYYQINGKCGFVKTEKVKPIDTTGAGDAFYGTALAGLDGRPLASFAEKEFHEILEKANAAGAAITQCEGALQLKNGRA